MALSSLRYCCWLADAILLWRCRYAAIVTLRWATLLSFHYELITLKPVRRHCCHASLFSCCRPRHITLAIRLPHLFSPSLPRWLRQDIAVIVAIWRRRHAFATPQVWAFATAIEAIAYSAMLIRFATYCHAFTYITLLLMLSSCYLRCRYCSCYIADYMAIHMLRYFAIFTPPYYMSLMFSLPWSAIIFSYAIRDIIILRRWLFFQHCWLLRQIRHAITYTYLRQPYAPWLDYACLLIIVADVTYCHLILRHWYWYIRYWWYTYWQRYTTP